MLLLELGESHGRGEVSLWIHGAQGSENGSLATVIVLSSTCWLFLGPFGRAFRAPIAH